MLMCMIENYFFETEHDSYHGPLPSSDDYSETNGYSAHVYGLPSDGRFHYYINNCEIAKCLDCIPFPYLCAFLQCWQLIFKVAITR